MSPSKGYLIPEDVAPLENDYIIVAVPRSEGHRRAFWGAMGRLGYWWAWERDAAKQGKDCAARWRDAIAETMDMWKEIGNLSPLTINVNCNSAGSALCCNQQLSLIINNTVHLGSADYEEIVALPGGQVDNGWQPPSSDWVEYTPYQQYKCNYALQFSKDLLETCQNYADWTGGFSEWTYDKIALFVTAASASNLIKGLIGPVFTKDSYMERLTAAILGVADISPLKFIVFGDVVALLSQDYIKCIIYNANSADQARTNLMAMWDSAMTDAGLGTNPIDEFTKYEMRGWFALFVHWTNLEPAFDKVSTAETFAGASCNDCAGPTIEPGAGSLSTGLLHYWEFNEGALPVDSHGTYDFDLVTSGWSAQPGITGTCVQNDAGSVISIGSSPDMVGPGSWTMVGWIKIPIAPASARSIAARGYWFPTNYTNTPFRLWMMPDRTWLIHWTSGGAVHVLTNSTPLPLSEWHMFAFGYDAEAAQMWHRMDLGAAVVQAVPGAVASADGPLAIGNYWNKAGTWGAGTGGHGDWRFSLDELAWWGRKLAEEEVTTLYNVGQAYSYANIMTPGAPA